MPKSNHVDRKNGKREYRFWPSYDHPTPTLRFPAEFLREVLFLHLNWLT